MKYIIYCRKSTDTEDKQVLSLDSQRDELLRVAESQNLNVVDILTESMSAKAPGRPVFNTMMTRILSGEADAILCWKVDRLTRNPVDGGQIQWLLQNENIKVITTFEKSYLPNDNVLIMSIEQAMANQYIRELSVNVKRGNRAKLERGEWPNHAPFGYTNDKVTKTIKINKKYAKYVKRAYDLYITGGYSLSEICEVMYSEGLRTESGRKVYVSQIHRILTNRFYTGLMERDNKVYQGNHEPIVSLKTFNQAEEIRNERLHPKAKKHFYSARGFLTCASCGCAITCDTKKGYQYYYCTNAKKVCTDKRRYMRSEHVDKILSELFLKLQFDEELIELSAEAYKQKYNDTESYSEQAKQTVLGELKSLDTKESNLLDGFISQIITKPLYEEKSKEIKIERIALSNQLKEIKKNSTLDENTFEQIKNVFIDCNRAAKRYTEVSDDKKRRMLEKLLSNASIEDQNIASYKFKSPYSIIEKTPKMSDFSTLLADRESNPDLRYQKPSSYR